MKKPVLHFNFDDPFMRSEHPKTSLTAGKDARPINVFGMAPQRLQMENRQSIAATIPLCEGSFGRKCEGRNLLLGTQKIMK